MRIYFKTIVPGHYLEVMDAFDRQLFEALDPGIMPMQIKEFTGSKKGDRVRIGFPFGMEWVSSITDDGADDTQAWFVDEGVQLPPGLGKWHHQHIVEKVDESHAAIVDDIRYEGTNIVLTYLLYPFLYLMFWPRKRIYQKYFQRFSTRKAS